MRYLPIKKVEAGMVLAQDILDGQGVMLLGRHQILNQEQIENLDKMGYPGLYIDDKFSEEIEIDACFAALTAPATRYTTNKSLSPS